MTNSRASSSGFHFNKTLTADQTVNNSTTLVDIPSFTFNVVSGTVYHIIVRLLFTSSTVADIKWALTMAPSGTVIRTNTVEAPASSIAIVTNAETAVIYSGSGVTTDAYTVIHAFARPTDSGTIKLQFAQNTQEVSDTKMKAGTTIQVSK